MTSIDDISERKVQVHSTVQYTRIKGYSSNGSFGCAIPRGRGARMRAPIWDAHHQVL